MDLLTHFEGLQNEHRQYVAMGDDDRVGQVQAELDRVGALLRTELEELKSGLSDDHAQRIADVEAKLAAVGVPGTAAKVPVAES